MTTRAVLYARCSSQRQANRDLSVPAQLRRCQEYAQRRGYLVVGEFRDDGISASGSDRPAFQQLLEEVRAGAADVVVSWDQARVFRNLLGS